MALSSKVEKDARFYREVFNKFIEKLANVFTEEGTEKISEALENSLFVAMNENYEQGEKVVEKFANVKEQLENFV